MEASFVLLLAFFTFASAHHTRSNLLSDYCKNLSKQDIPWSVTTNPKHAETWEQAKRLLGLKLTRHVSQLPLIEHDERGINIPDEFDSRTQWPECSEVIGDIRDQGNCGSCWAISSTSVMSDRLCIQSKGKVKKLVSAQDLMDCCSECGNSCTGANELKPSFEYWQKTGLVSGGETKEEGCKRYRAKNEKCEKNCDAGTNLDYKKDLTFANSAYSLKNATQMQIDIMKNGPIVAGFLFYDDLHCYDGKVYWHTTGAAGGGHAVRIIGWGVEDEKPYWLIANSWGTGWGLQGWFKMLRGSDECAIESMMIAAGLAKV